jgi:hypothetical protein
MSDLSVLYDLVLWTEVRAFVYAQLAAYQNLGHRAASSPTLQSVYLLQLVRGAADYADAYYDLACGHCGNCDFQLDRHGHSPGHPVHQCHHWLVSPLAGNQLAKPSQHYGCSVSPMVVEFLKLGRCPGLHNLRFQTVQCLQTLG